MIENNMIMDFSIIKSRKNVFALLSIVFLLSSVLKSVNIHSFALETRMYIDVYMNNWLRPLAMTGAMTVCVIEMLTALLALKKAYRRIITTGFFFMLSFFVYLTGLNLFFPTIMGSIESCGCFGELIHFTPLASFIKSMVLWGLSLLLVVESHRSHDPWNIAKLMRDRYFYISIVVSMVLPLYSFWFFERLNHTGYIIGFVALCIVLSLVVIMSLRHK